MDVFSLIWLSINILLSAVVTIETICNIDYMPSPIPKFDWKIKYVLIAINIIYGIIYIIGNIWQWLVSLTH